MLKSTFRSALTLLLPLVAASPVLAQDNGHTGPPGPPSTVYVPQGEAWIGSSSRDIEQLLKENEAAKDYLRSLDGETPQQEMEVAAFYIMTTEVTNGQYASFVEQTGHRPPFDWAHPEDMSAATLAFLEEEQRKKVEAEKESRRYAPKKFLAEEWWDQNWQDQRWQLPPGRELHPVCRVDYSDAVAYCTWAGLRLPTEFEFQRAGRGDSKHSYPWGDQWEDGKYAVTSEVRRSSTEPVASLMAGISPFGVFDLSGNVWEWTSSPYLPYEGFKPNKYKIKGEREPITPAPSWDGNRRVVMGGCYQGPRLEARLTIRRPADRTQMTNSMGFRAAASTLVGYDVATALDQQVVRNSRARDGARYDPSLVVAQDRWDSVPSKTANAPEGYSIITGYDYFVFVPAEEIAETAQTKLEQISLTAPIQLGYLATDQPILEPTLEPGVYLLAYRAKGKLRDDPTADPGADPPDKSQQGAADLPLEQIVDVTKDNLLFYDAHTGELAHHQPIDNVSIEKPRGPSSLTWVQKKVWEGSGDDRVQTEQQWLKLSAVVRTILKSRSLNFELDLRVPDEVGALDWRTIRE